MAANVRANGTRVRGEDTLVEFVQAGQPTRNIVATEWDFEYLLEMKSQGYIGASSDEKDEVFKGLKIHAKLHLTGADLLLLADQIVKRARRQSANFTISALSTVYWPGGGRRRMKFTDIHFSNIPVKAPARDQYVDVDLTGECFEAKVL